MAPSGVGLSLPRFRDSSVPARDGVVDDRAMATPMRAPTTRRLRALGIAAGVVASAVLIGVSSPAQAVIDRSGLLCFSVKGNPGDAAVVNLTPVEATARGNGQLLSSNAKNNPPKSSNTNYFPGSVDPNVAITPIGNDGQVCYQNSTRATIHLVADHLGTIAGNTYTPASPNGAADRRVDTREGLGGTRIAPGGQLCFDVDGNSGDAAIVNLTPVEATARGNGQLLSSNAKNNPPKSSNTNYFPGSVDPNVAITPIGNDGQVCYQNSTRATIHLVADHLGTIAGNTYTPASPNGAADRRVDTREGMPDEPEDPKVVRSQCAMPATTRYDTTTAGTMFGLASRAYEIEPGVAEPDDNLAFPATSHFPDQMACWELRAALRGDLPGLGALTDTEVIVARNVDTDDLVVSFRGTEFSNPLDVLTDLNAIPVPWVLPDGRTVSNAVHGGFAGAYLAVRDQLMSVLRQEQRASGDGTRVYFTGHSLGGALATIGSIDLVDDLMRLGYQRTEVVTYTYGAPRSLSTAMSNHHASFVPVSFAVVNPHDPVPHLPSAGSHIRNVTVLHGIDGTRNVRRNFGDGRDYGGCVHLIPDLFDHDRAEYNRRVGATRYYGTPSVWVTRYDSSPYNPFDIDNLRMHWSTPIEGPCDQVALWNRSSEPTSLSGAIRDRWATLDTNDRHSTTVNVDDANWIGYVDMFGKVISTTGFSIAR